MTSPGVAIKNRGSVSRKQPDKVGGSKTESKGGIGDDEVSTGS
jgi:hypothetical protein